MAGTLQYSAPEYLLGEAGTSLSDIFSLGVITYQMLTGRLPYGAAAARVRTKAELRKLRYKSALDDERKIPAWIDQCLRARCRSILSSVTMKSPKWSTTCATPTRRGSMKPRPP